MRHRLLINLIACFFTASLFLMGCGPKEPTPRQANFEIPNDPDKPSGPATFPLTIKDIKEREVTLDKAPQRIVSMSPPITETLFALGLGDRVVGVTRFCNYPPEAAKKEIIGGVSDPSAEKIISLNPDIVFATVGNPMPVLDSLEKAGITIVGPNPKSFSGVMQMIQDIGQICDVNETAAKVAGAMNGAMQGVGKAERKSRPKALFIVWLDPLFVAGPGTFMADMLQIAGATNVAGETANPWKEYSLEMAVAANPEVLVISTDHNPQDADKDKILKKLRSHKSWQSIKAVKDGRIVLVNSDIVTRSGPRLAQGLQQIADGIHPPEAEKGK